MSRRPSVSRMRENRTYGLKGGWGTGPLSGTAPLTTNGASWKLDQTCGCKSRLGNRRRAQ